MSTPASPPITPRLTPIDVGAYHPAPPSRVAPGAARRAPLVSRRVLGAVVGALAAVLTAITAEVSAGGTADGTTHASAGDVAPDVAPDAGPGPLAPRVRRLEARADHTDRALGRVERDRCLRSSDEVLLLTETPCDSLFRGGGDWRAVRDREYSRERARLGTAVLEGGR